MDVFRVKFEEAMQSSSDDESAEAPPPSDIEEEIDALALSDDENPFYKTLLPPSVLDQDALSLQRGFDDSLVRKSASESHLHGYKARDSFFQMYHRRREGRLVETSPERPHVRFLGLPSFSATTLVRIRDLNGVFVFFSGADGGQAEQPAAQGCAAPLARDQADEIIPQERGGTTVTQAGEAMEQLSKGRRPQDRARRSLLRFFPRHDKTSA